MNKRQLKKKVKAAKFKKEQGLILSLEDWHFIRNYGKCYFTQGEAESFLIQWDEITAVVKGIVDGIREGFADMFQEWADSLRRKGDAE